MSRAADWSLLNESVALPGPLDGSSAPLWSLVAWVVLLGMAEPVTAAAAAL